MTTPYKSCNIYCINYSRSPGKSVVRLDRKLELQLLILAKQTIICKYFWQTVSKVNQCISARFVITRTDLSLFWYLPSIWINSGKVFKHIHLPIWLSTPYKWCHTEHTFTKIFFFQTFFSLFVSHCPSALTIVSGYFEYISPVICFWYEAITFWFFPTWNL